MIIDKMIFLRIKSHLGKNSKQACTMIIMKIIFLRKTAYTGKNSKSWIHVGKLPKSMFQSTKHQNAGRLSLIHSTNGAVPSTRDYRKYKLATEHIYKHVSNTQNISYRVLSTIDNTHEVPWTPGSSV